jgi:hypothetical protein
MGRYNAKELMHKILTLALLMILPNVVMANCGDESIRTVFGADNLASKMYSAVQKQEMGGWETGTFHTEKFYYIGNLTQENSNLIHVGYLNTVWGASCRATLRLIFMNENYEEIGQYYSIEKPELIAPNTLSIPYEEQDKTIWEFKGTLPKCLMVSNDCFPLENAIAL